jgi:hypothetical protein
MTYDDLNKRDVRANIWQFARKVALESSSMAILSLVLIQQLYPDDVREIAEKVIEEFPDKEGTHALRKLLQGGTHEQEDPNAGDNPQETG